MGNTIKIDSNIEMIVKSKVELALRDFISTIEHEVLNMIQNPYFDKDKLKWNIK